MEQPKIIYRKESSSSVNGKTEAKRPDKYHCLLCKEMYMDLEEINDHVRRYHVKEFMKAAIENAGHLTTDSSHQNSDAFKNTTKYSGTSSLKQLLGNDAPINANDHGKKSEESSGLKRVKILELSNIITTDILKIYEKDEEEFRARRPKVGYGVQSFLMPHTPVREEVDNEYLYSSPDTANDDNPEFHKVSTEFGAENFVYTPSPPATPESDPLASRDGWVGNPTREGEFSPVVSPSFSHHAIHGGPKPKWQGMSPRQRRVNLSGMSPSATNEIGRSYMKRKYGQILSPLVSFNSPNERSPKYLKNYAMIERKECLTNFAYADPSRNNEQGIGKGSGEIEKTIVSSSRFQSDVFNLFGPPRHCKYPDRAREILTKTFGNPKDLKVDPYFSYLWEITMERRGRGTWDPDDIQDFARIHGWSGEHIGSVGRNMFLEKDYPFRHYLCRKI